MLSVSGLVSYEKHQLDYGCEIANQTTNYPTENVQNNCQVEITGTVYKIGDPEIENEDMRNSFSDLIKFPPFLGFPIQILMYHLVYETRRKEENKAFIKFFFPLLHNSYMLVIVLSPEYEDTKGFLEITGQNYYEIAQITHIYN